MAHLLYIFINLVASYFYVCSEMSCADVSVFSNRASDTYIIEVNDNCLCDFYTRVDSPSAVNGSTIRHLRFHENTRIRFRLFSGLSICRNNSVIATVCSQFFKSDNLFTHQIDYNVYRLCKLLI